MKKMLILILTIALMLCTFSACGINPEKKILGKWYNEDGDCLQILSDNTYYIDQNSHYSYMIGLDSGEWVYLEEEGFFKFYANDYDESVISVEIDKDQNGTYIEYTYYGTFYKQ